MSNWVDELQRALGVVLADGDAWRGRRDLEPIVAAIGRLVEAAQRATTEGLTDEERARVNNAANVLRGGRVGSSTGAYLREIVSYVTVAVDVVREGDTKVATVAAHLAVELAEQFGDAFREYPDELGAWLRTAAEFATPTPSSIAAKLIRTALASVPPDASEDERYRLLRFDAGSLETLNQRIASATK